MSMRLLFFHLIFLYLPFLTAQTSEDILKEAQVSYQEGEKENSYQGRNRAFNKALHFYQLLEQEYPQSADLDQALGDAYFQLNEYPWAILYYQRALKEKFSDPLLLSRLKTVQERLGLTSLEDQKTVSYHFFFYLSQQTILLFGVIFMTFIAFTYTIWFPNVWIKKWAIASTIFLCLLVGNALFFYYFSPLEAIIIKTTGLYRAPDWNQSQLTSEPLLAGSKVQIVQITEDGNWLKINDKGLVGYIPIENLRPITLPDESWNF